MKENIIHNNIIHFGTILIPYRYRKSLINKIDTFDLGIKPYKYIILAFLFVFLLSFLSSYIISESFFLKYFYVSLFILLLFFIVLFWRGSIILIESIFTVIYKKRITEIERSLPNFLMELSINLRSGMTFVKALENSQNPELGYINNLIKEINLYIKLNGEVDDAFRCVVSKYNSKRIREVFDLLIKSVGEGGKTIELTDNIIHNLNTSYHLADETEASVSSYIMFIKIISVFIAPLLFSTSYYLLLFIKEIVSKFVSSNLGDVGFVISELTVNEGNFLIFTFFGSVITSFCAAYIIGLMKSSKKNLQSYLLFVVYSSIVFWICYWALSGVFGNLSF
jgi:hypothetical protein